MKKQSFFSMNLLIFSALVVGSCRVAEPLPDVPNTDYSIIDGDTVKTVVFKDYKKLKDKDPNGKNYIVVGDTIVTYREPKLHTPPAKAPDLSKLKNNDDPDLKGKPLRMVAIGGSLTAGVRDGGYFNEGILTSYPNLIARQMRLSKFEQPLFDTDSYNGFGRKTRTGFNPTGGPVPKFNEVKNNSGVESVDEKGVKLKKYNGKAFDIDNLGVPNFKMRDLDIYNDGDSKIYNDRIGNIRSILNNDKYYWEKDKKLNIKFDLFLIELMDDIFVGAKKGFAGGVSSSGGDRPYGYPHPVEDLLNRFSSLGIKGCILNIPDVSDFPYFNLLTQEQLNKAYMGNPVPLPSFLPNDYILIPSSKIDSALSSKVNISLKPSLYKEAFPSKRALSDNIVSSNQIISNWAIKNNYSVVDIYNIYKKIINGNFKTDDGIIVDPSLKGNFFSLDGIYPTPFGQAVIANEVIKTINSHYKIDINLIPTKEYLNR